jgi:hypothetical protein
MIFCGEMSPSREITVIFLLSVIGALACNNWHRYKLWLLNVKLGLNDAASNNIPEYCLGVEVSLVLSIE